MLPRRLEVQFEKFGAELSHCNLLDPSLPAAAAQIAVYRLCHNVGLVAVRQIGWVWVPLLLAPSDESKFTAATSSVFFLRFGEANESIDKSVKGNFERLNGVFGCGVLVKNEGCSGLS